MSAADDPPESEGPRLTGHALLQQVSRTLAAQQPSPGTGARPLYRVVEVTRDPRGRLSPQGQIWHSDLDHVRRFGRALGANSVSQRVLIADGNGAVLEQIPVLSGAAGPLGWGGWRDLPLPPLPPRKAPPKPRARVTSTAPPPAARPLLRPPLDPTPALPPGLVQPAPRADAGAGTTPPRPPREIPVVEQASFDPEATATLAPSPPV